MIHEGRPALVAVQHRIPAPVKEWLTQEARLQERSANWLVCKVLTEAMYAATAARKASQ